MALTYSTAVQDAVALRLFGCDYDDLATEKQTLIDNASATPTGGIAKESIDMINRWSSFVDPTAGSDDAPDAADSWLINEIVYRAAARAAPELIGGFRDVRDGARAAFFDTYNPLEWDETSDTAGVAFSHVNLRRQLLDACVKQRAPMLPSPEAVDAMIVGAITALWNLGFWSFRRKPVTFSVSTSSVVTTSPSVDYKAVVGTRLFYTGATAGSVGGVLRIISDERMAVERARGYDAGKPAFASLDLVGGSVNWSFDRTPDQAYTFEGVAILQTPPLVTSGNIDDALDAFPAEHHQLIRDLAVARLLRRYNVPNAVSQLDEVNRQIRELAITLADVGSEGTQDTADERDEALAQSAYAGLDGMSFGGGL